MPTEDKTNTNTPTPKPSLHVSLAAIENKDALSVGDMVPLQALISDDKRVKQVEFWPGSKQVAVSDNVPWKALWQATAGDVAITVKVSDIDGNSLERSPVMLHIKRRQIDPLIVTTPKDLLSWDGENSQRDLLNTDYMQSVPDTGSVGAGLRTTGKFALRPWNSLKSPTLGVAGISIEGYKAISFSFRFQGDPPLKMSDVRFSSVPKDPTQQQYRLKFYDIIKDLKENTWRIVVVPFDVEQMEKSKLNPKEVVAIGFVFSNGEKKVLLPLILTI